MSQLSRFTKAQEGVYDNALSEIRSGRKDSHWMWFIFPQLKGLGRSEIAKYYGMENLAEATEYLSHRVLGTRLIEISKALLQIEGRSAHTIFGSPDDFKLRSSMTLFSMVKDTDPVFGKVLEKYFSGRPDDATIALL